MSKEQEESKKTPYRAKKNSREYLWHDTHYLSFKKCKKEKKSARKWYIC